MKDEDEPDEDADDADAALLLHVGLRALLLEATTRGTQKSALYEEEAKKSELTHAAHISLRRHRR